MIETTVDSGYKFYADGGSRQEVMGLTRNLAFCLCCPLPPTLTMTSEDMEVASPPSAPLGVPRTGVVTHEDDMAGSEAEEESPVHTMSTGC